AVIRAMSVVRVISVGVLSIGGARVGEQHHRYKRCQQRQPGFGDHLTNPPSGHTEPAALTAARSDHPYPKVLTGLVAPAVPVSRAIARAVIRPGIGRIRIAVAVRVGGGGVITVGVGWIAVTVAIRVAVAIAGVRVAIATVIA